MTVLLSDFHQVASRVQKYFIKLAKSGLPIPGRLPNLNRVLPKVSVKVGCTIVPFEAQKHCQNIHMHKIYFNNCRQGVLETHNNSNML